tara:strand:+ start:199 stop:636 length:438 start_codon:yes stop_codon:yes gene_type:complete
MNIILNIEGQIYDLMTDMHALDRSVAIDENDNDTVYRENIYWAARGMCRVACQFTNDSDECDMFDRIQQDVLQQLANDSANKLDDDREEVAAEVAAHVETVVDDKTSATLEELFGAVSKPLSENDGRFEIPSEPMEAPANNELFF